MTNPTSPINMQGAVCPMPIRQYEKIVMGHGSGGRMTRDLIQQCFMPFLNNPALAASNDFASLSLAQPGKLIISTDAHIVSPIIFPGGDIGKLAVCGTVNDVAMAGAIPLALASTFILEEGLSTSLLQKIVQSMAESALEAGVSIVAADTKVVERGKADGIFISTTGYGIIPQNITIDGAQAKSGDVVLISGTLGDHGIAVLSARGDLAFETDILSDVAPLSGLIHDILQASPEVHVLRDPTRGGLATTLNEIAEQSQVNITIEEIAIPVKSSVKTACEMLGFDPLYVANEGKVIVIVPKIYADSVLATMQKNPYGNDACQIGFVNDSPKGRVLLKTQIGATRILDVMAGEMLPRIC